MTFSAYSWHHLLPPALLAAFSGVAFASGPVVSLTRSIGVAQEEEIRLYLSDGTHKNATQIRLPVTVIARIEGDRPLTEAEEDELRAAALVCDKGHVLDVTEERDGAVWAFRFDCVTPGRALP
ncbi:hypothetical protein [Frigidibacter sp. ROC022]|uniref:hypothetical protein n=1 Tax=Frigidibacter sp. ROC022 TaxID=2971796 RepID=UPI00215AC73D|nr:hypothetical protein [Frigidibacter sp. ROC022]MCR8723279.1 hypothetical protein [Frigidibacter sp. ROC022]